MPKKLQPVQVVTYPKKIVYKLPENDAKNFFDTFAGIFLINILTILTSIATAGIGTSVAVSIGVSQLSQTIISTSVKSLINFSVSTIFDAMRQKLTVENLVFNALFSVTDIGKIGRGWKEDKLIRLLNQSEVLTQFGYNQEIKNFYQLKEFLKMKDILLKNKTKISFQQSISDPELLQSIFLIADSELKREIKRFSYDQLKTLLDIEKIIYKVNPKLVISAKNFNLKKINKILVGELNLDFNDFLQLNDVEAVNALIKLQGSKIRITTLNQLNLLRMQSKFQRNVFEILKDNWKNLKNRSKKLNPFYWAKKFTKQLTAPLDDLLISIRQKALQYLPKIPEIGQKIIKENNLIPCQPASFLLAFNFEPVTLDGSGYITIYKKPYMWKKELRISQYHPVRVWTNLWEVKQFVIAQNQSIFYNENWALGYGFRQSKLKNLTLISPGMQNVLRQIHKFNLEINKTKIILELGIVAFVKNTNERRAKNFINQQINRNLAKFIGIIQDGKILTSSLIKSIKSGKWNYSWNRNDLARFGSKKIIQKGVQIKNARTI